MKDKKSNKRYLVEVNGHSVAVFETFKEAREWLGRFYGIISIWDVKYNNCLTTQVNI